MAAEQKVTIRVRPSGWLVPYFEKDQFLIRTPKDIKKALAEIRKEVGGHAQASIPEGGMMIFINGKNARSLMQQGYLLRDDDEVTLVPVVAGG
ncbi:MAG: MoaD/ThiS family protein [Desulfobacterales bacterium]|nr:MAG: MoaD/ThiS family protein [Desulfobacterales bacterium]